MHIVIFLFHAFRKYLSNLSGDYTCICSHHCVDIDSSSFNMPSEMEKKTKVIYRSFNNSIISIKFV